MIKSYDLTLADKGSQIVITFNSSGATLSKIGWSFCLTVCGAPIKVLLSLFAIKSQFTDYLATGSVGKDQKIPFCEFCLQAAALKDNSSASLSVSAHIEKTPTLILGSLEKIEG